MNLKILYCFTVLFFSLSLPAETTFYGKLGITAENENNNVTSESDLVSNSSRIGFKGDLNTGSNLSLIYQFEYEVDPVDGKADEQKGSTFKRDQLRGGDARHAAGRHPEGLKEEARPRAPLPHIGQADMAAAQGHLQAAADGGGVLAVVLQAVALQHVPPAHVFIIGINYFDVFSII